MHFKISKNMAQSIKYCNGKTSTKNVYRIKFNLPNASQKSKKIKN